jgi:mRNA interferase MazF
MITSILIGQNMDDLQRGDIIIYAAKGEYQKKPRPGVIVQRQSTLEDAPSITICGLTTTELAVDPIRVRLVPDPHNGLADLSHVMIDKIGTIPRHAIKQKIGILSAKDIVAVDQALCRWLEL